jgi:galactitol-specific phosphotransferase system IIB component|tara:strand:+ start:52 stop:438 length:387 start_codon:yes stop_codon:yes gene_type:complete
MNQGQKANFNGESFEAVCENLLQEHNIEFESQVPYTNLYGSNRSKMDIVVGDLYIECKFQDVSGSVDEKIPFVMENLEQFPKGMIVLGGKHWKSKRGELIYKYINSSRYKTEALYYEEFVERVKDGLR